MLTGKSTRHAFERFSRRLGEEIERDGITEEQLLHAVKEAKKELYEERHGRRDT